MAIVAGLHCDVISCELARRGAWRARPIPAAEAESSACGCDSAVSLSLIARGQFFPVERAVARKTSCIKVEKWIDD